MQRPAQCSASKPEGRLALPSCPKEHLFQACDRHGSIPDDLAWLQIGLKCADLGHLSADWAVHRQWVERLEEEMFRQGDKERSLHLPLSPLADRTRKGVTQMQVSRPPWAARAHLDSLASHVRRIAHMVDRDAPLITSTHLPLSC